VALHGLEALAALPGILAGGRAATGPAPAGGSAASVTVSASGHVERPGLYEVSPGTPLRDVIDGPAGGVWKRRALKAAFPRGLSGPILSARDLEVSAAAHWSVARDRSRSCALIVLDETTDARALLFWLARSYELASREHCGPCREASAWILRIAERLRSGGGRPGDAGRIAAICRALGESRLCAEAPAASSPIESLIEKFGAEIERGASKTPPGDAAPHG
ncbi:MAG: NADH-ubiquinone oxidoreductase-F iron-sulfur binding region domain-containing protein, partial [Planctomycetota bacterium]